MYIDVILPLALSKLLTYSVPAEYQGIVTKGVRVVVQVGQKKLYTAIVYTVHDNQPKEYNVKEILSVIDDTPVVNAVQLKFWLWISRYYMCSMGEVMKAALPAGLKMESETKVTLHGVDDYEGELDANENLVITHLNNKEQTIADLSKNTGKKNILPTVLKLLGKGIVSIHENLKQGYAPKTESYIRLHPSVGNEEKLNATLETVKRAKKQYHLLITYLHLADPLDYNTPALIPKKDLLQQGGTGASILKTCIDKNIFEQVDKQVTRIDTAEAHKAISTLNDVQQQAYQEIVRYFGTLDTVLLHGVTSSGKTEIYIQLINDQLEQGKQVLYLLPEIALTTQIIERLQSVFGNKVGVYHSHFNDNQRVEIYNNLLKQSNGEGFVILGVRSSVFLPFSDLGLVIVDEEHENSYKQYDPAPRYHARDSAIVLGQLHDAKILLGTATPAIETYFNAKAGKYGLVELNRRFGNIELPVIEAIDMVRARKKKQVHVHFSAQLLDGIEQALGQGEQVILFQNRRGFSPYVMCQTCGYTPRCEYCDVSLTYHKFNNQLVCHYCGYTVAMSHHCPSCHTADMQACGFGTEKIEEELKLLLPDARIERLDLDATRVKNAYQRIIHAFEQHEIDILVGTQMITKGLDFDNVSLVGILNADNMLNFPDFRAHERSFQLMAQVGGRAGRKNKQGKVLIQTGDVTNPVIRYVKKHDYQAMFQSQIDERRAFNYPPFSRLLVITLKHTDRNTVYQAANALQHTLKSIFGNRLAGPETPMVNRIQNKYLLNFRLKLNRDKTSQQAKVLLKECFDQLVQSKKEYRTLVISVDVDPM